MKKQIFFTLLFIGYSSLSIACPSGQSIYKEIYQELTPELAQRIAVAAGSPAHSKANFEHWDMVLEETMDYCTYRLGKNGPGFFSINK